MTFLSRLGKRYTSIRTALKTACEQSGVYATALKDSGIDLLTISRLLGHSAIHVTATMYIEVPDEGLQQAA